MVDFVDPAKRPGAGTPPQSLPNFSRPPEFTPTPRRRSSGGGSSSVSSSTPVASTPTGTLLASGEIVPQSIQPQAQTLERQIRSSQSSSPTAREEALQMSIADPVERLKSTREERFQFELKKQLGITAGTLQSPNVGDATVVGFSTPRGNELTIIPSQTQIKKAERASQGTGLLSRAGRTFTFINTLGGTLQFERDVDLRTGTLPVVPSPAASAKILGSTRVAIAGVTSRTVGGKVLTDLRFQVQRPFFPFGTTSKGVASTETIFSRSGRIQPFISRGNVGLINRGTSIPRGGEVIKLTQQGGFGSAGIAVVQGNKLTTSLSVGRFAPRLIQPSNTIPFANIGVSARVGKDIGLISKGFQGTGNTIFFNPRNTITTAGLIRPTSRISSFNFIPQGTRGQASLSFLSRPQRQPLFLQPRRLVGISQAQNLANLYAQTLPTPRIITQVSEASVLSPTISSYYNLLNNRQTLKSRQLKIQTPLLSQRQQNTNRFNVLEISSASQRTSTNTITIPRTLQTPRLIPVLRIRQNIPTPNIPFPTFTTPRPPISRSPIIPIGFFTLQTKPKFSSGISGNFFARYSPSLTSRAFNLFGKPSKRALTGQVTPFERRFLLDRKNKRRRRNILGI